MILFAGDTAYTEALQSPGARAGRPRDPADRRLRPVDRHHASPEQAWEMAAQIGARYMSDPSSTFRLSREPVEDLVERLMAVAGDERWRVVITEVGQTWTMPGDEAGAGA